MTEGSGDLVKDDFYRERFRGDRIAAFALYEIHFVERGSWETVV